MPHGGNKSRGSRGKRKQKQTHIPTRPLEEVQHRLQKAITKSTALNQSQSTAASSNAASLPADAGDRGSDSELLHTPAGVIHVSDESDSDGISIPSDSEGVNAEPTTTITYPTPYHKVETTNVPDGRITTKITVLPTTVPSTEHKETTSQTLKKF